MPDATSLKFLVAAEHCVEFLFNAFHQKKRLRRKPFYRKEMLNDPLHLRGKPGNKFNSFSAHVNGTNLKTSLGHNFDSLNLLIV